MYYKDLTEYTYTALSLAGRSLNIGWLDALHPFQIGRLSASLLDKLKGLYRTSINQTRGFHLCPFCDATNYVFPTIEVAGTSRRLGSAEILLSDGSTNYLAPDLLIHYIECHSYQPPIEFMHALECMENPQANQSTNREQNIGGQ